MRTCYQTRVSFDYLRDYTLGSPILRAELPPKIDVPLAGPGSARKQFDEQVDLMSRLQ